MLHEDTPAIRAHPLNARPIPLHCDGKNFGAAILRFCLPKDNGSVGCRNAAAQLQTAFLQT
jgi:hypothetical protein